MKHTLNEYRGRWSRAAVVVAPSVNIAVCRTVRTVAFFGGVFGAILLLSAFLAAAGGGLNDPDGPLATAIVVVAGLATMVSAYGVYRLVRVRERKHGVLIAADVEAAPQALSLPLLDALTAADTIRESRAYQDKWLTDVDLDAALWDLAQHVKTGTELRRSLDGIGVGTDAATLGQGRAALDTCTAHVRDGAARLADLARRVDAFDEE